MTRIQYLFDETGHKTAVMIDLKRNKALWGDFDDHVLAERRRAAPRESLADVRRKLIKAGKLNG